MMLLNIFLNGKNQILLIHLSNKNIIIKDLFTHTSGLTYGFQGQSEVDENI